MFLTSIEGNLSETIPGLGDLNGIVEDIAKGLLPTMPTDLSSLKTMLSRIEQMILPLFATVFAELTNAAATPITAPEEMKFQIKFLRGIDPTSLYLWESKRMTGFNVSWYFQDEKGNNIPGNVENKDYLEENRFFKDWINTMKDAIAKGVKEERIWDIIKETRQEYIREYFKI